jgi:CDP-paratose 2-epimerase
VQDLLRAFAATYENRARTAGQVYNIGGGPNNATSLLELLNDIERSLHIRVKHRFRPARPGDQPIYITDFSKFSENTSWRPEIRLSQTIDDISQWYHANRTAFVPTDFPVPSSKVAIGTIGGIAS